MNLAQLKFSGSLSFLFQKELRTLIMRVVWIFFFYVWLDPKEVCKVLLFFLPEFRLGGEQGS